MIEQGIVKLVQEDADVAAIATAGGGYFAQLPKGQALPSWSYQVVSSPPQRTLLNERFEFMRLQIDCYGDIGADAVRLAKSIDAVLDGYRGTLSDSDATQVDSCFQSDVKDFPLSDASRSFRRMLEYEIHFYRS